MTRSSWRLPAPPLRGSIVRAFTSVAIVTTALSLFIASQTMSGADYAFRTLSLFLVAAAVVLGLAGAHYPLARLGAANAVTTLRVGLVAMVAAFLREAPTAAIGWTVVVLMISVAALDGIDGWLARRTRNATAFGARYDIETDAAMILVLSVLVWQHGKAGIWVIASGLMRYGFVAAGWVLPWMAGPLRSTLRGKSVAIMQFMGLGAALAPIVPLDYSNPIAAVTLATLVWSFAIDIAWLKRQATASRPPATG